MAKLSEELNLSETQQDQLTALMESQEKSDIKKGKGKKELSATEEEAMKAKGKGKADKDAYNTRLAEILTTEQLATSQEMKAARKE
ncbi:MAG: hypothetical protein ACI8P3_003611 [Saprospiraceae bacterium]